MAGVGGFRSAEEWLERQGVEPESVIARGAAAPAAAEVATRSEGTTGAEAEPHPLDDAGAGEPAALGDEVARAAAFLRRSANAAPQSEQRLADKLAERGTPAQAIELALRRARTEGLVDDAALAAALVAERRARGHAPARIRRDLAARGFGDDVIAEALPSPGAEDLEAAAFGVAAQKADRLTAVAAETAYRRVAAHVVRRGYGEGLARKVARQAVYAAREAEHTAGH